MKKTTASLRRKARRLALQAIYQWQLSAMQPEEIKMQFMHDEQMASADVEYFIELVNGVPRCSEALDEYMQPILDRSLQELTPVELAILRIAVYEFLNRLDVPYKVIINEALELAKTFGALDGFKYVNGILDQVARKLRAVEIVGVAK